MSALLKRIRQNSLSKHSKLSEDWLCNEEPVCDGVSFFVKYLGSMLVDRSSGEEVTAEAIKNIISMAKKQNKKLTRVSLTVSLQGIKMTEVSTGDTLLDISIYRISYCSADATYDHVFALIATNSNDTLECHAFLCPKRKMAEAATLTIAQAFNLAYECWQASQERGQRRTRRREASKGRSEPTSNKREKSGNRKDASGNRRDASGNRRDASGNRKEKSSNRRDASGNRKNNDNRKEVNGNRVSGQEDGEGGQPLSASHLVRTQAIVERTSRDEDKTTSPSSGYNSCSSTGQDEETFLIDLSSPGDSLDSRPLVVAASKKEWIMFEDTDQETADRDTSEMDRGFQKLSELISPAPLLAKLPPYAAGLEFGALAGSPGRYSSSPGRYGDGSPYGSPIHGASLTHSLLATPVGSPLLGLPASPQMRRPLPRHHHQLYSGSPSSNSPGGLAIGSAGSPSYFSFGSPSYQLTSGSPNPTSSNFPSFSLTSTASNLPMATSSPIRAASAISSTPPPLPLNSPSRPVLGGGWPGQGLPRSLPTVQRLPVPQSLLPDQLI